MHFVGGATNFLSSKYGSINLAVKRLHTLSNGNNQLLKQPDSWATVDIFASSLKKM